MGLLRCYASFLIKNPGKVLIGGVGLVLMLFGTTLLIRPLPNFKDPLTGFEARDTLIASRLNAWKLLLDESTNNLSLGPNSLNYEGNLQSNSASRLNNELNFHYMSNNLTEPPLVEMSIQNNKSASVSVETLDEDENEYYQTINSTSEILPTLMHYSLESSRAFCGKLYEGYAQVIVAPSIKQASSNLFNLNSMLSVCQLDRRLRLEQSIEDSIIFQRDCERFQVDDDNNHHVASTCCNSWSLPNYIACLNNKTSCIDIDSNDLKNTEHLLNFCAPYYYKAPYEECFSNPDKQKDSVIESGTSSLHILSSSSHGFNNLPSSYCGSIPDKCLRCDGWIFTVMYYLTNENFVQIKLNDTNAITAKSRSILNSRSHPRTNTFSRDSVVNKLIYTNIFLPIAKSSSLLNYYHALSRYSLKTPYAQVKAMDLGLKNSLFDYLISDDTRLFIVALISILIVISIYTWSVIISLVILIIICLSLCLSYTIYELIFNIPIFPFMNLLAVVISFGICSDNAMLFCKHWASGRENQEENQVPINDGSKNADKEQLNLDRMLQRAIISTFVATLATACSFIISAISKVIAVRCFCFFATLSVITNYLLIVMLLPPALILDSRLSELVCNYLADSGSEVVWMVTKARDCREKLAIGRTDVHNKCYYLVTRFKFYLIITFITLLSCSSILVFHRPTLQPADEDDIQLLSRKHTFEQYDRNLRKQFAFERFKSGDILPHSVNQIYEPPDTLPVRIVFGIKPIDNGNHLDPHDRGTLSFDPKFDIADSNAQIWLLEFCRKLKLQRFIHPSHAPDLSNCFMETFKSWMDARSCRDPIQTDMDRSPCCQSTEFPYTRHIFNQCIGEAVSIVRKTPRFQPNLHAGVRFFKNTTKVAALVIEYQSNRLYSGSFTKMERFFNDIDDWVTWQINNTAPPTLKSGWFISNNLELLALQTELGQSTTGSIILEVVFAMLALMVGTRDLVLTLAGTLTIGTIIIVTVAALIILKWTLGVAESILISLTIGLSIDFALHYTVSYSENRKDGTAIDPTILTILKEVGSPIALATITTLLAGFVIVWSDILAYQELGVFLMLIAMISWLTSTFFLLPMLATIGSFMQHGELYVRILRRPLRRTLKLLIDRL